MVCRMKIVITGGKGMLGRTLQQILKDHTLIVADLPEVDITDIDLLDDFIAGCRPDVVIHTAAMTAVDRCESEVDLAYRINELGSRNVAAVCKKYHSRLMAISTDYVFDGNKSTPYSEFDNATGGATVYGQSKFAGEKAVQQLCPEALILRTSWLYGSGGPSFVHTMVDLACQGKALKVVSDQWGNPTSALEVARKIRLLLEHPELRGVFHLTCEGGTNWFEFALEIFKLTGLNPVVTPCSTGEFPRPAPRPANSQLEKVRLKQSGLAPMMHWREALNEFVNIEFGNKKSSF